MALAASVNSGRILSKSTAYTRMFFMGVTGLTLTVTLSKAGGSFAAAGGSVSEVASGWYKIALTTTDTNTLGDLAYHATDGGTNIEDFCDQVSILQAQMADAVAHGGTTATLELGSTTATPAFYAHSSGGDAFYCVATSATGAGIKLRGTNSGAGLDAAGGSGGAGIIAAGGATSGAGLSVSSSGNNSAIEAITSYPNQSGAAFVGGTNGSGILFVGNGSGAAIAGFGGANGDGLKLAASGTGHDVNLAGDHSIAGYVAGYSSPTFVGVGVRQGGCPVKNTAFSNFAFPMFATDGSAATGKTVTATRSIDGGAFATCANSVSEISGGWYKISFAAADFNGDVIAFKATASGCNDTDLTILTQP